MHEFSLARGLFAQLQELAEQHRAKKITVVRVDIGRLSGIVVDSFTFGFEVLAAENPLTSQARLVITMIDPVYRCRDCGVTAQAETPPTICAGCGSRLLIREGGDELILKQVEME